MQAFHIPFPAFTQQHKIRHHDNIVLCGSCFTEHIGSRMLAGKMNALINPNGILFNPMSMAAAIGSWMEQKVYSEADIFQLHETWNSWDFHSRFSHPGAEQALQGMNAAIEQASGMLCNAKWLLVTFGSAYQYFTRQHTTATVPYGVANCHKAPGTWFEKRLLSIEDMKEAWMQLAQQLNHFNPDLRFVVTVSPVKHIRDGIMENNRSKARLIELAHSLAGSLEQCSYFPAYEIVTDVLRDYRFYEQDMVHPNNQAAQYVWEQFVDGYMEDTDRLVLKRTGEINNAMQHRARFPDTQAGKQFREAQLRKVQQLQEDYPYMDFSREYRFFSGDPGMV